MPRLHFRMLAALLTASMGGAPALAHAASPGAPGTPSAAIEHALADAMTPRAQSQVLVLGSWHTGGFKDMEARHLERTLAQLERYAPTRIAIEILPPDEIALLAERARAQPSAKRILDTFAKHIVGPGQAMQATLKLDRVQAEARAQALLAEAGRDTAPGTRLELVRHLLAAYEFDSAVLQWSYLSPAERAAADVPEEIRTSLDGWLGKKNEIVTVAMALARRLGLQRLYPIDSQQEAVRTLAFPEPTVDAVFGHETVKAWSDGPVSQRIRTMPDAALASGDLHDLFRQANSPALLREDATQWLAWLRMDHDSGLDRFRYAMWELRNARMAGNILDAAASIRPERVLVVVGFSHKAYLDRELEPVLGVRLRQFDEFGGD